MRLISTITLLFILYCAKVNGSGDWCYEDPECGPSHWIGPCKSGKSQSPIDLNSTLAQRSEPRRLRFDRQYLAEYPQFYITNNGHTVQVQLQMDPKSNLLFDGDGLGGSYVFAQAHFHWGSKSKVGSEHTIDGKAFPMELHLVHYSDRYESLTAALQDNNRRALAVLGIFFQVTERDNPAIQPIIEAIPQVFEPSHPMKVIPAPGPLNLTKLLPKPLNLYRYVGSLTTPNCAEKVVWTVFQTPAEISERQLDVLRSVKDGHGKPMVNNYRPTQALAKRDVKFFVVDSLQVKVDDVNNNEIDDDLDSTTDTDAHGIDHEVDEDHANALDKDKKANKHGGNGSSNFHASAVLIFVLICSSFIPAVVRKLL